PADRRMYAARDVSGTVESIPLITSSILSKKLAEGIDALVMDVKVGRASFMREEQDAAALMSSLVATGVAAGVEVRALMTDMDHPLGLALGNALEVTEVLRALEGDCPGDLREVTLALGAEMLVLGGVSATLDSARVTLEQLWRDGVVRQVFSDNLALQGGDQRVLDDLSMLPQAKHVLPVEAAQSGFVGDVDPLALGQVVVDLGGGRRQPGDVVDPAVGVVLERTLGEEVARGDAIAFVHASERSAGLAAVDRVRAAMPIGDARVHRGPMIRQRQG
ncbi:MAG: thymidine phosphorylase, partial [Planctomycetota bacterium]|nr:thymidine phosphorylase [Planctomycetota bacterium]